MRKYVRTRTNTNHEIFVFTKKLSSKPGGGGVFKQKKNLTDPTNTNPIAMDGEQINATSVIRCRDVVAAAAIQWESFN